jgi:O-antigen/teichoic acid export membrane protein
VCIAYIFFEVNYLMSLGLDLSGKTKFYPLTIGLGAVASIGLNVLLIPRFQMMGAALAMCFSYLLLPLVSFPIVQKQFPIPYEGGKLLRLLGLSACALLTAWFMKVPGLWVDFALKVVIIALWITLLFVTGFFTRDETARIRSAILGAVRKMAVRAR